MQITQCAFNFLMMDLTELQGMFRDLEFLLYILHSLYHSYFIDLHGAFFIPHVGISFKSPD